MEFTRRVRKTDLARNTHEVIRAVQHGQTVLVENHGEPEAAIIDIVDYRILRAVLRFHTDPSQNRGAQLAAVWPELAAEGLSECEVAELSDAQARYDVALACYLSGAISLARAAELLGLTWLDLRTRLVRLELPQRTGPDDLAEAQSDADTATGWARQPAE